MRKLFKFLESDDKLMLGGGDSNREIFNKLLFILNYLFQKIKCIEKNGDIIK